MLTGDLDNDGRDEAVVLLWESSGGSGVMRYVAAVGWRDGDAANLGANGLNEGEAQITGTLSLDDIAGHQEH